MTNHVGVSAAGPVARPGRTYETAATAFAFFSSARLLALQEQDAARAETEAERYRTQFPRGLVSRRDVDTAERAAAHAREQLDGTRDRMAEAERVVAEAEGLLTLTALPPTPVGEERATPEIVEYRGSSRWTLDQVASLERFFAQRFGRALPVSALGQTLADRFTLATAQAHRSRLHTTDRVLAGLARRCRLPTTPY